MCEEFYVMQVKECFCFFNYRKSWLTQNSSFSLVCVCGAAAVGISQVLLEEGEQGGQVVFIRVWVTQTVSLSRIDLKEQNLLKCSTVQ